MITAASKRGILVSDTLAILRTRLTAKSSSDRTRGNSCYAQPAASADRDADRALKAQPSSPFLCRLATSRCDKQPSPARRSLQYAPRPEKSSRDRETSEPTVGNRRADRRAELRADRD